MRRTVVLGLVAMSVACAHTRERWGDEEDPAAHAEKKDAPKADTAGPPVSFVVASNDEGEGTGDALDKVQHDPSAVKPAEPEAKPAGSSIPVVREKKGKEIPVIIEKAPPEKMPKEKAPAEKVLVEKGQTNEMKDALREMEAELAKKPKPAPEKVEPPAKSKAKKGKAEIPVVVEKSAAPEYDPFQKLDRDMARVEEPAAKAPPPKVAVEDEERADPPPPPKKKSNRDPNRVGLSVLVGAGVLASNGVIPGYGYHLAYGGQVAWNPAFAGDFALDVGFWRSGTTSTTGFSTVDTADNHTSVRIMFLPTVVAGFYMGLGVGGIATYTQAHYRLGTELPSEVDAGAIRFGGDGTVALGYRFWHVEARIDLRALYLQGNRLEFLPTGSIGATF